MLALGLPLAFVPRVIGYWILNLPILAAIAHRPTIGSFLTQQAVMMVVDLVPSAILAGLICDGVAAKLRGDAADRRSVGLRWLAPLLGGGLLAWIGTWLGLLLLAIPGIVLRVAWSLFTPVVVLEQKGPISGLRRSAALTRGHRWTILGLMLIFFLAFLLLFYGSTWTVRVAWYGASATVRPWLAWGMYGAASASVMLYTLFWRVAETLLFFELVRLKSGAPVESLAKVFD